MSLPNDFNINAYKKFNDDLKDMNDQQLKEHYLTYGIHEGRIYKYNLPDDFDVNGYKIMNIDLKGLNNEELINHYVHYGINEKRVYKVNLPDDFDVEIYKDLNDDLKNMNEEQLKEHYLNYGINEGRTYKYNLPDNFDVEIYKDLNDDLKNMNEEQLKEHYLNYGINEDRLYNNICHDWIKYINTYENVNQYKYNKIEAIKHFYNNKNLNKESYYFNDSNDSNILNEEYYNILLNDKIIHNNIFNKLFIKYSFIIVTNKYGISIANNIKLLFDKLNIESKIIYDLTEKDIKDNENNKNEFFFILFHYLFDNLPKNKYIIYQLEQINQSKFINNKFIENIKNSLIVFDYSLFNIYNFNKYKDIFLNNKLYYLPLPINNINNNEYNDDIEFDIIFYGSRNYRRDKILNNIKNKYKVKILYNVFGEDVINLIKKSKIVLNLHYYKNANLEVARINEILIYNKLIISELGYINDNNIDLYKNNIIFIEELKDNMSNINILYDKLDFFLDNTNYNNYLNSNNNRLFINNIFNKSLYYLDKYMDIIQNFNIKKEVAVICCNYGNYDINENNINILNNNDIFDWFYFTDLNIILDKWNVINNDYHSNNIKNIHNNDINRMISKYYKFQSLNIDILQKYKYLIWMDTAIMIENKDFVNNIINLLISNNNELFIFEHYKRNNIKDEFFESMNLYKYKNQNMVKQVKEYIKNGLCDNKLYETGFIIYKNCESIKNLMNEWWNEINLYSYQCQISAPYVFYKNNITPFILNEFNFKKTYLEGSVWKNNLYGYVKFNHLNNTNCSKIINYNKINGIDYILWINLERSRDRKKYMEDLLNNINIKNMRINAIDGKNNNTKDFLHNIELNRELSNYEIACTLSHIKAINKIKDIDGEYFLILEDDVTFDNISIFEENLEDIIKNSPEFDILILYKTYLGKIDNLYVNWNDYYTEYPELNFIGGTVSYIISKKNILKKLDNFPKYISDVSFRFINNRKFDVCDLYIYKFFNTFVYKYNYISTSLETTSTIHNNEELHKINYLHQMNIIKNEYF